MPNASGPEDRAHSYRIADIEANGDLLRELHHNYLETYQGVARSIQGGRVDRCGNHTLVRTGVPEASFNPVFALESPGSYLRRIPSQSCESGLGRRGVIASCNPPHSFPRFLGHSFRPGLWQTSPSNDHCRHEPPEADDSNRQ